MKIIKSISPRGCNKGLCPSLLLTDAKVVLIQGVKVLKADKKELRLPGHEDVVSIPKAVFDELLGRYQA